MPSLSCLRAEGGRPSGPVAGSGRLISVRNAYYSGIRRTHPAGLCRVISVRRKIRPAANHGWSSRTS